MDVYLWPVADFVCHDKKREAEAFSCWSETVKERFSALAMEAKGPIVHQ